MKYALIVGPVRSHIIHHHIVRSLHVFMSFFSGRCLSMHASYSITGTTETKFQKRPMDFLKTLTFSLTFSSHTWATLAHNWEQEDGPSLPYNQLSPTHPFWSDLWKFSLVFMLHVINVRGARDQEVHLFILNVTGLLYCHSCWLLLVSTYISLVVVSISKGLRIYWRNKEIKSLSQWERSRK